MNDFDGLFSEILEFLHGLYRVVVLTIWDRDKTEYAWRVRPLPRGDTDGPSESFEPLRYAHTCQSDEVSTTTR